MADDALAGVARDATTLLEVLEGFASVGYEEGFRSEGGARVRCLRCHVDVAASGLDVDGMHRLEGASDPADMLVAVAATCPTCGAHGVLVANYGPEAMIEDAEVLRELESPPPPATGPAV
jgi:hypothetical protein